MTTTPGCTVGQLNAAFESNPETANLYDARIGDGSGDDTTQANQVDIRNLADNLAHTDTLTCGTRGTVSDFWQKREGVFPQQALQWTYQGSHVDASRLKAIQNVIKESCGSSQADAFNAALVDSLQAKCPVHDSADSVDPVENHRERGSCAVIEVGARPRASTPPAQSAPPSSPSALQRVFTQVVSWVSGK